MTRPTTPEEAVKRLRALAYDLEADVSADPQRPRVVVNRATLRELLVLLEQVPIAPPADDRLDAS